MGNLAVWQDLHQALRTVWTTARVRRCDNRDACHRHRRHDGDLQRREGRAIDPLPYPDSDRLVRIVHNIGGIEQTYFNDAIITTYAENTRAFESLGVWVPEATGVTITGDGEPREVRALTASRASSPRSDVSPGLGAGSQPKRTPPARPTPR